MGPEVAPGHRLNSEQQIAASNQEHYDGPPLLTLGKFCPAPKDTNFNPIYTEQQIRAARDGTGPPLLKTSATGHFAQSLEDLKMLGKMRTVRDELNASFRKFQDEIKSRILMHGPAKEQSFRESLQTRNNMNELRNRLCDWKKTMLSNGNVAFVHELCPPWSQALF